MSSRAARRLLFLGLAATSIGCSAAGTANMPTKMQPQALPNLEMSAKQAIEKHNLNASRLVALQADPRIAVSSPDAPKGSVTGRMALERPKNFKLEMRSGFGDTLADIGSNEDEFWFWTKSKKDRSVYVCSYEDVERTPLSAAFQPEWIIEAMGFRPITPDEAAKMKSERGDAYGTTRLISNRRGYQGEVLTKETVIDSSGRIIEHRLYEVQKNRRTLVALATIDRYQEVAVSKESTQTVSVPYSFHLEWIPQRLALDIQLMNARCLPEYRPEARKEIFSEPRPAGSNRVNLALMTNANAGESRRDVDGEPAPSRTRQSRAMPDAGNRVRLGVPESVRSESNDRPGVELSPELETVGGSSPRP